MSRVNVHATGLVLGKAGLILRGIPGAGKSLLALELLDEWEARELPGKLVSDDRVELEATPQGLVMHAPKTIEGLISNYQRIIDGYIAGLPGERLAAANRNLGNNFDGPVLDLGL